MTLTKPQILEALRAFIAQRPGLDFADYGDAKAYRAESRQITRDRHDAEELLRAVSWRDSIGPDQLREAFRAYSGRLTLTEQDGRAVLSYCTGQYFPTEYRRAACAVLASALWSWARDNAMPEGSRQGAAEGALWYPPPGQPGKPRISAGEWLRRYFRREFGARLAARWFN